MHLTDDGQEATAVGQRIGKEVGKEFLAALTPDERKQLNALLRKVAGLDEQEEPPRNS